MTTWAHEAIGHTGMGVAQSIVMLDDELDLAESGVSSAVDARPVIEGFLISSRPLLDRFTAPPTDA